MSKSITRLHIRGKMGVQILQAATALSRLDPREEPVICVNTRGLSDEFHNKLPLLFQPACRVIDIDDSNKTPYWVPGAATSIFQNRNQVLSWLGPMFPEVQEGRGTGVHVRGGDKLIASKESNDLIIKMGILDNPEAKIYTNDESMIDAKYHDRISDSSAEEDWLGLYWSKTVYAAPSAFIMSMLLTNPDKHIIFLSEKYCDGGYPHTGNDFLFLREAMAYCKNVEIMK